MGINKKFLAGNQNSGRTAEPCIAMDVSGRIQAGQALVKDVLGERTQRMFQDFLEE